MKVLLINCALVIILGCKTNTTSKDQLVGTYTKSYTSKFGTVWDTVEVKPLLGENMYQVIKRVRIETVVDGKKWPTKYSAEPPMITSYDVGKKVFVIEGSPLYSVDIEGATLTRGSITFDKLK